MRLCSLYYSSVPYSLAKQRLPIPPKRLQETPRALARYSITRAGCRRRPADEPARSIRVNADMTLVPATVTDAYRHNVQGLEKQNFRVFENAEQRSIVAFSREDAPVSVGLISDSNNSMRDKFQMAREAASQLLNEATYSRMMKLSWSPVSTRAELRQDFMFSTSEIADALVFTNPDGSTSLLDGVNLGLEHNEESAYTAHSAGGREK